MAEAYLPEHNSVLQYLKYCYLREKNGFKIEDKEKMNTYAFYKEYCEENDMQPLTLITFSRLMSKYGVAKKRKYLKTQGRRVTIREINFIVLKGIFEGGGLGNDKNYVTTEKIKLGEDWYHVITKYIKIEPINTIGLDKPKVDDSNEDNINNKQENYDKQ